MMSDFPEFTGRTIEDMEVRHSHIAIRFTDGSYGSIGLHPNSHIDLCFSPSLEDSKNGIENTSHHIFSDEVEISMIESFDAKTGTRIEWGRYK